MTDRAAGAAGGRRRLRPGYYNNRIVDDRIWQVQRRGPKDLETQLPLAAFSVGGNYTNHDKIADPGRILRSASPTRRHGRSGVPDEFRLSRPITLDRSWADARLRSAAICSMPGSTRWCRTTHRDVVVQEPTTSTKSSARSTSRRTSRPTSASTQLTGNIGVQAVHTDQQSAAASLPTGRTARRLAITERREILGRDAEPEPVVPLPERLRDPPRPRARSHAAAHGRSCARHSRYGVTVVDPRRA